MFLQSALSPGPYPKLRKAAGKHGLERLTAYKFTNRLTDGSKDFNQSTRLSPRGAPPRHSESGAYSPSPIRGPALPSAVLLPPSELQRARLPFSISAFQPFSPFSPTTASHALTASFSPSIATTSQSSSPSSAGRSTLSPTP